MIDVRIYLRAQPHNAALGKGGRLSILLAKGCRGFRVQGLRVPQKKIELVGIPFEDAACTMQVVHGDAPSNIVGCTSAASNRTAKYIKQDHEASL